MTHLKIALIFLFSFLFLLVGKPYIGDSGLAPIAFVFAAVVAWLLAEFATWVVVQIKLWRERR